MTEVLVVANRTLGGPKLLDAVRARARSGDVRFRLIVPQSQPSAGLVIYDEAVRESAQVRVDLALSVLAAEGIAGTGEVGDPDPFLATMDAMYSFSSGVALPGTRASSSALRAASSARVEALIGLFFPKTLLYESSWKRGR